MLGETCCKKIQSVPYKYKVTLVALAFLKNTKNHTRDLQNDLLPVGMGLEPFMDPEVV